MKHLLLSLCFPFVVAASCSAQQMVHAAAAFIRTLDTAQKSKALYPFDIDERFNFHFFPKDDRKGIPVNELNAVQLKAAWQLVQTGLSLHAFNQVQQIRQLENVLKVMEHRGPEDHFRDSGKYYFTIFGLPSPATTWGWRLEGHHVSFTFTVRNNLLISGSPGFLGSNPGIVTDGPEKGKQVLKEEADKAFNLLHSLSTDQLSKALIDTTAPNEIITFVSRKAMIEHPAGLLFSEMNAGQQEQLLQLVRIYVYRYTKLFGDQMLKSIQQAGFNNIRFAWAGYTRAAIGKPHYYRIQGPGFIIEYDNSQSNGNHVHSVLRDLNNDFGDALLEHYKDSH